MPRDSAVADLNTLYRQAKTARSKLEPDWYMNNAFYQNQQWLAWGGGRLFRPQMPKSRITIVDNRIQPAVRKEIARLTKNRPQFVVVPTSADQEDANAAQLAEQLMRYLWRHLKLGQKRRDVLQWSRVCGAGFWKMYWDPTTGDKRDIVIRADGKLLEGSTGGAVYANTPEHRMAVALDPSGVRVKTVAQGDIKVEVRSPFQIFPDPLAAQFDEVEWLIEESVKSSEYVRRRYGVDVTADTPANPGLIEARMGGSMLAQQNGGYMGVKVREYWCKPNATHPKGRRAVWVITGADRKGIERGQLLEEDDAPFDPMPYIMFSGIPVPGRLFPMSIVDALRGLQVEMNKVKSQMAENRGRVGNPTILASKQAVQDPDKFAASMTVPGGIAFFDDVGSPNAKPDILQAPPLPDYVVEEPQRIAESFQEISGQHEVTSAQVPPGVTAASAINLLQESDDTMLAPDIAAHEDELAQAGRKLLKLASRFYTDPRIIQIGGDNGAWQIYDFRGSQLRGNTHLEVQIGPPKSRAAQQAQMTDMLTFFVQSGNPPHGRQLAQYLQDNDLGSMSKLIADYTRSEEQANSENARIVRGEQLPINPYDDDQAHIANHEDFERSAQFGRLPPQVRQLHLAHTQLHRDRVAQQQQATMQLQMQMQGNGPEQQQSDLQGQQQGQVLQAAQQGQQLEQQAAQHAQQQGFTAAQSEQSQRQAEEAHARRMQQVDEQRQQALEQHQQRLRHQDEQHQARLRAQSQPQREGAPNGR